MSKHRDVKSFIIIMVILYASLIYMMGPYVMFFLEKQKTQVILIEIKEGVYRLSFFQDGFEEYEDVFINQVSLPDNKLGDTLDIYCSKSTNIIFIEGVHSRLEYGMFIILIGAVLFSRIMYVIQIKGIMPTEQNREDFQKALWKW